MFSLSSGISSFHSGLILILWFFSSYSIMPCLARNCKNSVSLSIGVLIWLANSGILCHFPSFTRSKKSSGFIVFLISVHLSFYLKRLEPLMANRLWRGSVFFDGFLLENFTR